MSEHPLKENTVMQSNANPSTDATNASTENLAPVDPSEVFIPFGVTFIDGRAVFEMSVLDSLIQAHGLDALIQKVEARVRYEQEAALLDADAELDTLICAGRFPQVHAFDFTGEEAWDYRFAVFPV
jgi:hypothetical protein